MKKLLLGLLAIALLALLTIRVKPAQVADCSMCGLTVSERTRRPCPRCGSTARSISTGAEETFAFADRAG